MKITAVRVRKLVSGPGYNHTAIEAEAAVEIPSMADQIRHELSEWVDYQIEREREGERLAAARSELNRAVGQLQNEKRELSEQIEKNRKIIREHMELRDLARANNLDADGIEDGLPF